MNLEKIVLTIPSKTRQEREQMRSNAEKMAAKGSLEAQRFLDALDEHEAAEQRDLAERARNLPRAQLVEEAFTARPMTEAEMKVVQVLLDNPGSTSRELSRKAGYKGQSWHMHFGTMCSNRLQDLWPAPRSESRSADFYSGILTDYSQESSKWTMKPEAVEGFAALGLRGKN